MMDCGARKKWLTRVWVFCCVGLVLGGVSWVPLAGAQEQFFTQSGGRGLQNAKTNARLTKAETDIGTVQSRLEQVKAHAFAELGVCGDTAEKLRWDGSNWVCEKETDPTVQTFAKKALPSCGNGTILSAAGGDFACVPASFVSDEVDPTVQAWAKGALPSCGSGEVLSASGGGFSCVADKEGLPNESDPYVHDFAKKGVATVPNCSLDDTLTMIAGRLVCRNDQGLLAESDPMVQDFARNDVSGSDVLAACASGEVLKAAEVAGKVRLVCSSGSGALTETLGLNDLNDVNTAGQTSGTFLGFNGSDWRALVPVDSTVQGWARTSLSACSAGQVLTYNGTSLSCVADVGGSVTPTLAGLSDVNVSGVGDGQFLQYDSGTSKWVFETVQPFALASLPTCAAGQVLSGNGTSLSCVSDAGASGNLSVANISVTTNAQVDGALTAGSAGFGNVALSGSLTGASLVSTSQGGVVSATYVNAQYISGTTISGAFVGDGSGLTGVVASSAPATDKIVSGTTNVTAANNASVAITTAGVERVVVGATGNVGVGTAVPNAKLEVSGIVSATSLVLNTKTIAGADATYTYFYNPGGTNSALIASTGGSFLRGDLLYFQNATGTINRLFINSSGNVGISTTTPNAKLDVFGLISSTNIYSGAASFTTVNANSFVGDGSGLTGVVASSGDRISSGTTSLLAVSNTGYVSLTQAGVNTGWFDPARGLVTLGVSATGGISGTSGYFSGNLGVGTSSPNRSVDIESSGAHGGGIGFMNTNGFSGVRRFSIINTQAINPFNSTNNGLNSLMFSVENDDATSLVRTIMSLASNGNVGMGTTSPTATLHVSGTALITSNTVVAGTVQIAGVASEVCDATRRGAMRFVDVGGGVYKMQACRP